MRQHDEVRQPERGSHGDHGARAAGMRRRKAPPRTRAKLRDGCIFMKADGSFRENDLEMSARAFLKNLVANTARDVL